MTISQSIANSVRRALLPLAAAALLGIVSFGANAGPAQELSTEDKTCLECHAKPAREKRLSNGDTLPLKVSPKAFQQSVHGTEGCEACHSGLVEEHEKKTRDIASRRALAIEMQRQCTDCHKKAVKLYEDSVHAALVAAGSDKAPLCSDCHNPHAAKSLKDAGASEPVVCAQCHKSISQAMVQSVHGSAGEDLACKDCHKTHNVKAAAIGNHLKNECLSCHKETAVTHAAWLPNASRHLEAVSCPACHSPGAGRRVNLTLYEGAAPQSSSKVGVPTFVKLTSNDAASSGINVRALWSLLQDFSQSSSTKSSVRGRLEVRTGEQAHQIAAKRLSVSDCDTCHRQGAASFQEVTVSLVGPDGRPIRHEANAGILTSVESIGSVGGFYAIGSTRIKVLDLLLVLAVAAGFGLPGAHLVAKLHFKRRHAKIAAAQQDESSGTK